MSEPLYSLVYLSTALKPFSDEALNELLAKSRENNDSRGISGMLLYKNQHFMQALEGPEAQVRELSHVIRHDPRHTGMVTLLEGRSEDRHFDGWSMGYENLDHAEANGLPGYAPFRDTELTVADLGRDMAKTKKLLSVFWRRMG